MPQRRIAAGQSDGLGSDNQRIDSRPPNAASRSEGWDSIEPPVAEPAPSDCYSACATEPLFQALQAATTFAPSSAAGIAAVRH